MRGLSAALEPLRTSRRGHQQRATRVGLARIVQQRRAHEPAHAPLESRARHSRDLRGAPREREVHDVPPRAPPSYFTRARFGSRTDYLQRMTAAWCCAHHERAGALDPFEAAWRARKSTTSATGIAVSTALCARLAALPTTRGPPRAYRPRRTRQARARTPPPVAAGAQRR